MVSFQAIRSPKRLLRYLLHPSCLASIISVGTHGVLFAAGPTFTGLNFKAIAELDLPEEQRQVPLIELTAAEQQRLPDFSQSFYSLENFGELEPLNPLIFGEGAGTPEIGKTTPSSPLRGNNRPGVTSPPDKPPASSNAQDFVISSNSTLPLPYLPGSASSPDSDSSSDKDTDVGETNPDETEGAAPDAENSDLEATNNSPDEPSAEDLQTETANSGDAEPSAPDLNEFLAQGNSIADLPPEQQIEIFTTYNDALTTDEEENESYEEWIIDGKAANGNPQIEFFESEPLSLLTPEPHYCLQPEPQAGLVGALIDSEGNLLEAPKILRSTGYLGFNQQAVEFIRAQAFEPAKSIAAYRFPIVVDYDPETCVAAPEIKDAPIKENTAAPANPEAAPPESSETESGPNIDADQETMSEGEGAETAETTPSPAAESADTAESAE